MEGTNMTTEIVKQSNLDMSRLQDTAYVVRQQEAVAGLLARLGSVDIEAIQDPVELQAFHQTFSIAMAAGEIVQKNVSARAEGHVKEVIRDLRQRYGNKEAIRVLESGLKSALKLNDTESLEALWTEENVKKVIQECMREEAEMQDRQRNYWRESPSN